MTFELQCGATRRRIFRAGVENPIHDLQALTATLRVHQQFCEIQLDFQVFRLEIQRPSVAGHGLVEMTQIVQNDAQVIERLQKHWRDLNGIVDHYRPESLIANPSMRICSSMVGWTLSASCLHRDAY